jgi:hypothetical protein
MCEILKGFDISVIVSGGANGADSLGEKYANENKIEKDIYYPDWAKHGKAAGFIRNKLIIENADMVIAFWDQKSRGTRNSIGIAHELKKNTYIIYY